MVPPGQSTRPTRWLDPASLKALAHPLRCWKPAAGGFGVKDPEMIRNPTLRPAADMVVRTTLDAAHRRLMNALQTWPEHPPMWRDAMVQTISRFQLTAEVAVALKDELAAVLGRYRRTEALDAGAPAPPDSSRVEVHVSLFPLDPRLLPLLDLQQAADEHLQNAT